MVGWNKFGEKVQKWSDSVVCVEVGNKQESTGSPPKLCSKCTSQRSYCTSTANAAVKHWQRGGLTLLPQPAGSSLAHIMELTGESG